MRTRQPFLECSQPKREAHQRRHTASPGRLKPARTERGGETRQMKIAQRRSLKSHLQAKYRFGSGRAFLLDCGFNANGPCIIPVRPGALHIRVSWAFYWPLTGVDQK